MANSIDWSYPSVKQLSEFQIDSSYELGIVLGIAKDEIKKGKTSMAEVYLTAKSKNMELSWKDVAEGLVRIGTCSASI